VSTTAHILPTTEIQSPTDQASVAALIRGAFESETPVYPIGGGTCLDYGGVPTRPGLGVSLAKLHRVVDYPARDLTITVEAGTTVAELSKHLARERQRLPVDIPHPGEATLGGVVATSPSGPRRYRWGTMRDYVIGATAVDGRGTLFSAGGRVVKNAAGYDLCRLLTGSLGTVGVMTQVTLMVKPIPETSALISCPLPEPRTAERLLDQLVHTKTLPVAVEILAGPAWQDDSALASEGFARLVVGFEGTGDEVKWMVATLADEWSRQGVSTSATVADRKADALWRRLTEFPVVEGRQNGSGPLVVKLAVLPSATIALVEMLRRRMPECSLQTHAGNGIIRLRVEVEPGEVASLLKDRLRPSVEEAGGQMVVMSSPRGTELGREAVWGPPGDGLTVMQAIKDRFDPKGILNPGRFFG